MRKDKSVSNDPLPLLLRLNDGLEQFMLDAVNKSFDSACWDSLSGTFEPIRCWELKNCKKRKCPSYRKIENRCWLTAGTFCGCKVQGEFARKYKNCYECEIFTAMPGGPVRRLYENINTLISFIRDEARKLRRIAVRDPLTHLYNRHFFNEVIERETLRSDRDREPLSFIMMDLDHFKKINDQFGHLAGDQILKDVAALIQRTIRRSDLAFRFGGDEFLVLMLNADGRKAARMAKRLLEAANERNRGAAASNDHRISFSMGCATHKTGDDIHAVLRKADESMYRHKQTRKKKRAPKRALRGRDAASHQETSSSLRSERASPPEPRSGTCSRTAPVRML